MRWRVCDVNEWIYPDVEPLGEENGCIELLSARGSYAGCQLWWDSVPAGTEVDWHYQSNGSGHSDAISIEMYEMLDVQVNENTGPDYSTVPVGEPAQYATRSAPFRVFDALIPREAGFRTRSNTLAFYICWKITEDVQPHAHRGEIHLRMAGNLIIIPVEIDIHEAVVPYTETLAVTNWFSFGNIAKRHGLEKWSEPFWDMVEKYGVAMRRTRQTHFLVGMELTEIGMTEAGRYTFDFSRAARLIRLFLGLGFTGIEGGHLATRNDWDAPRFVLSYNRTIMATSPEGYAFISQYLNAWRTFLIENGWLQLTLQHIADEPIAESAQDYRVLSGMFRKCMPGVPLIDAVIHTELDGALDIWVPTNRDFERNRSAYDRMASGGDRLWFYTCWNPGGEYLNRFMDFPLLKTRYLHWGNYIFGLEGYLHWGFNYYLNGQDPFEHNNPMLAPGVHGKRVPAGDTHIVYPGEDGPWLSMRLEAMRMGVEDYELLQLAARGNRELADDIAGSCMKSFTEVELRADHFNNAYRRLLEAASVRVN